MTPKSFFGSVTETELIAIMEKYRFSEDDLDDINCARVVICELAHGPPPFDAGACCAVANTCGDILCVNPEHLEWTLLPSGGVEVH